MVFKIKANDLGEGLKSDQIKIEIELRTIPRPSWLIKGPYPSGDYAGLYYLDYGEYPQSQETNSTIINAMSTTADSKGYYTSFGKKYARKGTSPNFTYYLVEPVRWLIIGNGSGLNGLGFPDKNGNGGNDLSSNQLLLISEKIIESSQWDDINKNVYWNQTFLYNKLINLTNIIFTNNEQKYLDTFDDDISKLSVLNKSNSPYSLYDYGKNNSSIYKSICTNYITSTNYYWDRMNYLPSGGYNVYVVNRSNGDLNTHVNRTNTYGVRPIIIITMFN